MLDVRRRLRLGRFWLLLLDWLLRLLVDLLLCLHWRLRLSWRL